jgi:hypothetical protein
MINNEVEAQQTIRMDMPGTIGGAKLVFPEDKKMTKYTVKLDVRFTFEVNAESAGGAAAKAKYFQQTMKHTWGDDKDVCWVDSYPVKEIIERDLDV